MDLFRLEPGLSNGILSKFAMFNWSCLLLMLLVLVDVELPFCLVVTISYNASAIEIVSLLTIVLIQVHKDSW